MKASLSNDHRILRKGLRLMSFDAPGSLSVVFGARSAWQKVIALRLSFSAILVVASPAQVPYQSIQVTGTIRMTREEGIGNFLPIPGPRKFSFEADARRWAIQINDDAPVTTPLDMPAGKYYAISGPLSSATWNCIGFLSKTLCPKSRLKKSGCQAPIRQTRSQT